MIPIPVGATAELEVTVTTEMTVRFDELGPVHPVYATYTMAKHFEEAGRKLLLRHLEPGEAGIGRSVAVEHLGPSWVGDTVRVTARCTEVLGNRLTCECVATDAGGRELGESSGP
jgi:predicted thioesterase